MNFRLTLRNTLRLHRMNIVEKIKEISQKVKNILPLN
jgi:hypothetical protein